MNRTNFLSEVVRNLREATGEATEQPVHTVTVDEIAPEDELRVENRLNPTETEILTHIAAGAVKRCRCCTKTRSSRIRVAGNFCAAMRIGAGGTRPRRRGSPVWLRSAGTARAF